MPRLATVQDSADSLSISVALCTHNGAPFVAQQVRSILEQTVPPDQLILSDDASADETVETVRADPRFSELRSHIWRQLHTARPHKTHTAKVA